jgi:hypothetical protein
MSALLAALGGLSWLAACNAILGTPVGALDPGIDGGNGDSPVDGTGAPADAQGTGDVQGTGDAQGTGSNDASGNPDAAQDDANVCPTGQLGDGENCGACSHSCAGGKCFQGACEPFVIASLAQKVAKPNNLLLYGGSLYGTDVGYGAGGSVWKVANAAKTAVFSWIGDYEPSIRTFMQDIAITASPASSDPAFYVTLASNQSNTQEGVWWVPLAANKPFSQLWGFYYGGRLAGNVLDGGTTLYIAGGYYGGFDLVPAQSDPGVTPAIHCNGFYDGDQYPVPAQIAADANNNLYWMYDGTANSNPDAGPQHQVYMATPTQLATWSASVSCDESSDGFTMLTSNAGGAGFGFDSSYVYYSDAASNIWRVPIGGGPSVNLTANVVMPTGPEAPQRLLVDDSMIYWVAGSPNIWGVNKDGSSTGKLGPLSSWGSHIFALAVDSTYFYFTDTTTESISRLVKH